MLPQYVALVCRASRFVERGADDLHGQAVQEVQLGLGVTVGVIGGTADRRRGRTDRDSPPGARYGGCGRMYATWTKKGSSPCWSSQPITWSVRNAASECSAANCVGAQVAPWSVGAGIARPRVVQAARVGGDVDPALIEPARPRRLVVVGQTDDLTKSRQHPLVAPQPRVVGIGDRPRIDGGVGVTEQDRVIAGRPGFERDIGEPGVERRAVLHRTMVLEVHAGVQRSPARPARRSDGPVTGERHAAGGQRVERRRLHDRVPERAHTVTPPLIDRDEEDVAGHGRGRLCAGLSRPRLANGRGARPSMS